MNNKKINQYCIETTKFLFIRTITQNPLKIEKNTSHF